MGVVVWDLRMTSDKSPGRSSAPGLPVQRWSLHPHLAEHFENLYNSELLFERFALQYAADGSIVTGALDGKLFVLHPSDTKVKEVAVPAEGAPREEWLSVRDSSANSELDGSRRFTHLAECDAMDGSQNLLAASRSTLHTLKIDFGSEGRK